MTAPDLIARVRQANPLSEHDLEAPRLDALERVLERAAQEEAAPRGRRGRARPPLVLGAAGALAVAAIALVVGLAQLGDSGLDPVAEARAALGARGGVFSIDTEYRTRTGRTTSAPVRVKTWVAGRRGRSVQYGPGGPVAESVSMPGREPRTVIYGRLPSGARILADDPAVSNPRREILQLLRSGKLRDRGRVTVNGRRAHRLVISTRRGRTRDQDAASGTTIEVPAHRETTEVVVDDRSDLPLSVRRSRLVASFAGSGGTIRREVETQRYLTFVRLTAAEGEKALRPGRRFRGR